MKAKITKLDPEVQLPKYHSDEAAGFDIACAIDIVMKPGAIALLPTGLIIQAPEGHFLMLAARSSLAMKKGLMLANGIGIIDRDYCGPNDEIKLAVYNFSNQEVPISKGERLAQGLFLPQSQVSWEEVQQISSADRGGFGGTGGYSNNHE